MDRSLMPLHQCDVPVFHVCPVDPACPYCNGSTYGESAGAFDWSFLDGTYCISLKSRPDRVASAAAEFHRLGLCRHVLFYRPSKDPERPKRGIWESHRAVAEHARQRGFETTLILEDDVLFSRRLQPQKVRAIARALNTLPPDWMVFFLGHWPFWAYFAGPNMLRTGSACAVVARSPLRLARHPLGTSDCRERNRCGLCEIGGDIRAISYDRHPEWEQKRQYKGRADENKEGKAQASRRPPLEAS
jgi:hypothetical protein